MSQHGHEFKIKCSVGCLGNWKADGYRWYQNGRKLLPSSNPVVVKMYYFLLMESESGLVKTKDFRKITYSLMDDSKGVQGILIQYLGMSC